MVMVRMRVIVGVGVTAIATVLARVMAMVMVRMRVSVGVGVIVKVLARMMVIVMVRVGVTVGVGVTVIAALTGRVIVINYCESSLSTPKRGIRDHRLQALLLLCFCSDAETQIRKHVCKLPWLLASTSKRRSAIGLRSSFHRTFQGPPIRGPPCISMFYRRVIHVYLCICFRGPVLMGPLTNPMVSSFIVAELLASDGRCRGADAARSGLANSDHHMGLSTRSHSHGCLHEAVSPRRLGVMPRSTPKTPRATQGVGGMQISDHANLETRGLSPEPCIVFILDASELC